MIVERAIPVSSCTLDTDKSLEPIIMDKLFLISSPPCIVYDIFVSCIRYNTINIKSIFFIVLFTFMYRLRYNSIEVKTVIKFNLKDLLNQNRMTMSELADRTGISRATLSTLASGKTQGIQFSTLEKIATALGLANHQGIADLFSIQVTDSAPKIIGYLLLKDHGFAKEYLMFFERNMYGMKFHDVQAILVDFEPEESPSSFQTKHWNMHLTFSNFDSRTLWDYLKNSKIEKLLIEKYKLTPNPSENYYAPYNGQDNMQIILNDFLTHVANSIYLPKPLDPTLVQKAFILTRQKLFSLNDETFFQLTNKHLQDFPAKVDQRNFQREINCHSAILIYSANLKPAPNGKIKATSKFSLDEIHTQKEFWKNKIQDVTEKDLYMLI